MIMVLLWVANKRKRQQAAKEFIMTFVESLGALTNLNGSVTYRIQISAKALFNGVELLGDWSAEIMATTLEGD